MAITIETASLEEVKHTPKVYEADGAIIRKLPVWTKNADGSTNISMGFPVCRLTEWCDEQGEALAEIMNRGELYASSQAEIARLREALENLSDKVDRFNGVCANTGDRIADRAKGEMHFALAAAHRALSETRSDG